MIPVQFDYVAPTSLADAVAALEAAGEDAKLLAGGQSLMPVLRMRLAYPDTVIDLSRIPELRGIRVDADAVVVGSMTTHREVIADPVLAEHLPLVGQATRTVADRQVRNLGTFGGSVAHADPAGDLPAVALTLDAEFVAVGPTGRRVIRAADFFLDYLTTALSPNEILVEVRLPKHTGWGTHYEKFNRVAQAWSIVGVAAAVRREGSTIAEAKVGLTNMGSTPIRAAAVEADLAGQPATADAIAAAASRADEGTSPPSDITAQADYRQHLAQVLTKRALLAACGLA